jgi:hypothetical protein
MPIRLFQQYSSRALALFKQLKADDFFHQIDFALDLWTTPDLEALRSRADFKQFLEGLKEAGQGGR